MKNDFFTPFHMATHHTTSTEFSSAICRTRTSAICLFVCTLGLSSSASAQRATLETNPKEVKLQRLFSPLHRADSAPGMVRDLASAQETAHAASTPEFVLHNFVSPPHGAYPATGVIRDLEGNLYGTTNGSYSDIGGGGAHDAGVVFKIDNSGHQTLLYTFTGAADGSSPNGLVRDADGNLYGTATYGGNATGTSGAGVVFKVDNSGHETVLYTFTGGNDGGNPNSVIRDAKGNLYGATGAGGAAGYGVVFKIDPSGHETTLYSFTGGTDGAYPSPNLALDPAGNLYGAASYGGNMVGTSGAGVVFKLAATGHETVLYTFAGGDDGAQPNGVFRDAQGDLYGTTSDGGGSANQGVVFKVGPSGHETLLYTFTGGNDGGSSDAGVILGQDGNLYGTTDGGGSANQGVVFRVDKSGHETVLYTFERGAVGNQPYLAGVILDPDFNLYGTTSFNAAGGIGAVYKLDRSGNATVIYAFPAVTDGQYPYNAGVVLGTDGRLYGATQYGGSHGAGVLYQLVGNNCETLLYTFDLFTANGFGQPTGNVIRDAAGNFYGTTFIGQADVGYGYGVVYKVDASGHATVLHNFTGGADGGDPYGGVILDAKGNLYGTASAGGASGNGVVFKINLSGQETVLYNFTGGSDGGAPYGSLISDAAGNFYGTTNGGGAAGAGVVFKLDRSGNETVLYTFSGGADGGNPLAGLLRDPAGNFYGTTNVGGASGAGVVFKLDTSGDETALYSFTGGADGGYPLWVVLARDSAGDLYGTTASGGTANQGVVFKIDKSGNESVLHTFTGGADGGSPYTGVIFGPEGQLYGATAFGGQANVGVVFEIKP
jgi:uncharacterized repeat protein (TIGR03803 family)